MPSYGMYLTEHEFSYTPEARGVCFQIAIFVCFFLQDEVVLSGRGRSGRSVGDLSGVKYNVVKVGRYSLKRYVDRKIPRIP